MRKLTARRTLAAFAASAALAGGLALTSAAAASAATACPGPGSGTQPLGFPRGSELTSVTAHSPCDVWVAGGQSSTPATDPFQPLIEHWDGTAWTVAVTVQAPGEIQGIAERSPSDVWAVGRTGDNTRATPLILHWNGVSWTQSVIPSLANDTGFAELTAVAARTKADAWAVGRVRTPAGDRTLILHWDGTAWKRVPSPDLSGTGIHDWLTGVTTVSASDAWAVGDPNAPHPVGLDRSAPAGSAQAAAPKQTLILHWDGHRWKQVSSPSPGQFDHLTAVAAISRAAAWAVGVTSQDGVQRRTLVLRWDGHAWKRSKSPNVTVSGVGEPTTLSAVAASPAGGAWAVGTASVRSIAGTVNVVLRWDGKHWTMVTAPDPGAVNQLRGVITIAGGALAVGSSGAALFAQANVLSCTPKPGCR
jgi:hypothetical protein